MYPSPVKIDLRKVKKTAKKRRFDRMNGMNRIKTIDPSGLYFYAVNPAPKVFNPTESNLIKPIPRVICFAAPRLGGFALKMNLRSSFER